MYHSKTRTVICIITITLILLSLSTTVQAAKTSTTLNKKYWPLQTAYNKAIKENKTDGIIEYGTKIYQLFVGSEDPQKKASMFEKNGDTMEINILPSVIKNVASAYESKNNFDKAAEYYTKFLPFAKVYQKRLTTAQSKDYDFTITAAEHKITAYAVNISLYTQIEASKDNICYHKAKFEPQSGLYYGTTYELSPTGVSRNKQISDNAKKSSAQLIYVLFKDEDVKSYNWAFQKAKENCDIIELAWYLKGEGTQLKSVLSEKEMVEDTADYLFSLNTPVLLRFGAEMNIWESSADPKQFIEAFRFVADIIHAHAPNVAMLWSPNAGSAAGLNYSMFYPGDQYVDWVGISCYTSKYFLGNKSQTDFTQAVYLTGDYANPIEQIRPIVKEYGAKKPIMLSECGVENYSKTNSEDLTSWADLQLRRLYAYAPMVFPEIKAMLYFDYDFENVKTGNRYALYSNQTMTKLYMELTENDLFLPQGKTEAGYIYQKINNTSVVAAQIPVYCYFAYPKNTNVNVTYKIDGKALVTSKQIPYKAQLSFSAYKDGTHTLTIELSNNTKLLKSKTYTVIKKGKIVTIK